MLLKARGMINGLLGCASIYGLTLAGDTDSFTNSAVHGDSNTTSQARYSLIQ